MRRLKKRIVLLAIVLLLAAGNMLVEHFGKQNDVGQQDTILNTDLEKIPEYSGKSYVIINDNQPDFTESDMQSDAYEFYSEMDAYGRCGVAEANLGPELAPT